jgi:GTP-binding protein
VVKRFRETVARNQFRSAIKVAIVGKPNVGKSTLLNKLRRRRSIVSPVPGTTRDVVDSLVVRDGKTYRLLDTAGIRKKGQTVLMAEKLSVIMARRSLERCDVALIMIDATEQASSLDATIAGYAHEAGAAVILVVNKWDKISKDSYTMKGY